MITIQRLEYMEIEVSELLKMVFGKNEPVKYNVIFVVNEYGRQVLIASTPSLDWLVGNISDDISEILDEEDLYLLPKEIGLYKGVIVIHSFRSNTPDDPEEWDMNISISEIKSIDVLEIEIIRDKR